MHDAKPRAIIMRSKLFVPGSRPELFEKALQSGADAISIDLEDAVTDDCKDQARMLTAAFLDRQAALPGSAAMVVVRVNGLSTAHFSADAEAVVRPGLAVLNLPKVESASGCARSATCLPGSSTSTALPSLSASWRISSHHAACDWPPTLPRPVPT